MQESCHPTRKGVIQCKKFAIHRNKRDILQEKQAEKNRHKEKKDLSAVQYGQIFKKMKLRT